MHVRREAWLRDQALHSREARRMDYHAQPRKESLGGGCPARQLEPYHSTKSAEHSRGDCVIGMGPEAGVMHLLDPLLFSRPLSDRESVGVVALDSNRER